MKKKLMATVLAGVMAVSMLATGCGGSKDIKDGKFTPSKSIQWMCTSSAGGGSDIFTRKIGDIMTAENLVNGQTIVVTNKTDGAGEVGRNEVATMKNNADYQLLTFNSGNRAANFRILAIMAVDKQLLFKGQGAKYDKFEDVIAAVQNGEKVVIGGSKGDDIATYQALVAELGVSEDNLTYITYDSTGDAITAALGGHVEYVISKPAAASEYVEAGSLVPILAFSTERYTGNLADAPTLSEVGDYNDVEVPVWRGVAAPAAMSDAAVQYWSDTLKAVSETEQWKTEYIEANKLIEEYMDTAAATDYVTQYEADYLAKKGLQ